MALGQGLNTAIEDPGQERVWGLGKAPKGVLFFVPVKGETDGVGVSSFRVSQDSWSRESVI